jgi:type II secretory pathway component GspD/PulD (secretin)
VVTRGKNKILLVKDTAEGVEAVRQALVVMDKPTPQVLIEARFFQVTNGLEKRLGIDWQDLGTNPEAGAGANVVFTTSTVPIQYFPDLERGSAYSGILNPPDFTIILHALKDSADAKELANPKLVVNSDEQATIHIGEQQPILRSELETTDGGDAIQTFELDPDYGGEIVEEIALGEGAVSAGRVYTTNKGYLDLGTKLTVLPSVKTEEEVYIRVAPELMSQIGEVIAGQQIFPVLFRTYVRTQFTVRSGQTIAIGGLVSERESKQQRKVPLVGDIPGLGRLFRYEQVENSRSETIVFLTVKVIAGKDITAPMGIPIRATGIQSELERIEQEDAAGAVYSPDRLQPMAVE